ncbi:hypothetical protein ACFL96_18650 [Thermoproteota archaeon]
MSKDNISEDLEKKVGKSGIRKKIDWLAPVFAKYDAYSEADILMQDESVKDTGITKQQAVDYLKQSYDSHKGLYRTCGFADTADKATSAIGIICTASGIGIGFDIVEDTIELGLKAPALGYIVKEAIKNKDMALVGELSKLLGTEGLTAIPIIGDVYDIAVNRYVRAAHEIIRNDAKNKILEKHKGE